MDFILFTSIADLGPHLQAASIACLFSNSNNPTPIAGSFVYNTNYADPLIDSLNETISTIIHEAFHAIFFGRDLFMNYPKTPAGLTAIYKDSEGRLNLRSNFFLQAVRTHFQCNIYLIKEILYLQKIGKIQIGKLLFLDLVSIPNYHKFHLLKLITNLILLNMHFLDSQLVI